MTINVFTVIFVCFAIHSACRAGASMQRYLKTPDEMTNVWVHIHLLFTLVYLTSALRAMQ